MRPFRGGFDPPRSGKSKSCGRGVIEEISSLLFSKGFVQRGSELLHESFLARSDSF